MLSNVGLEKILESPLDCKEIKPVNPKENQLWIFIGRTDAEAVILWPPNVKSWLIGKDPSAGKHWRQEEKGMTQHDMVGWHHWLNGHEFEQTPWDSEGQGSLACCSPWGHKESDLATEKQNHHRSQFLKVNLLLHVYTLCWFYFSWKAKHTHPQWDVFRAHTVSTSCHRE